MAKKKKPTPAPAKTQKAEVAEFTLGPESELWRYGWLVLFLLLFPLYLTAASSEFGGGTGGDNVVYFLLGKALATGQGYVDLYLPGNPPHAKYPFMFPLLLAPFHLLFKEPLLPMHVMLILFDVGAVILAGMILGRASGSRRAGVLLALLVGTTTRFYIQNLHILSEPPFMFFCYLTLLLLPRGKGEVVSTGRVLGIAAAATAAFFTRTAGIAVAAAATGGLMLSGNSLRRRGRSVPAGVVVGVLFALALAAWTIRNRVTGAGSEYLNELLYIDPYRTDLGLIGFKDYLVRVAANFWHYYKIAGAFDFNDYKPESEGLLSFLRFLMYVFPVLIGIGAAREVRRGEFAVTAFVGLSLLIVFSWSYQDTRFLVPLWPFLAFYFYRGLSGAAGMLGGARAAFWTPVSVFTIVLIFHFGLLPGQVSVRFQDLRQPTQPVKIALTNRVWTQPVINYAKYEAAFSVEADPNWSRPRVYFLIANAVARDLTPPEAVLLSRKPMYTYLLSGRQCQPFLFSDDPDRQWEYLTQNRVDYIITGVGEEALQPAFQKWPQRFRMIARVEKSAALIVKVNR